MLATADFIEIDQRLQLGDALPGPRLSSPQSGLYAVIYRAGKGQVWKSPSAVGQDLPKYKQTKRATWFFEQLVSVHGRKYFSENFTVVWEDHFNKQFEYVFQVLEDYSIYNQQVTSFRHELWGWLAAVAVVLLLAQGFILRWSLQPLRKVASDIEAVKAGTVDRLQENYPQEIQGLTEGINTFIDSERAQRDRYRRTLADLAHSLKTPLAVLKTGLHGQDQVLDEQIDHMRDIVDYQLQRASSAGRTTMGVHTPLLKVVERLLDSLVKVHADKSIQHQTDIATDLNFPGEQGDLMELVGNLLENAYKWARKTIRVSASVEQVYHKRYLKIIVEDDGSGIPEDRKKEVLLRGRRADETVAGHGIGLSIVQEIVSQYGGEISLGDSPLGGARITLSIPLE